MSRTLKPDDRISHYRVLGLLGAGGMGEVYSAKDESLERSVALKILPPRVVRSEERVHRFIREAKSASSLNHPNIVTIYEIGRDAVAASGDPLPVHFISMELIDGETLTQKIHESNVPLRTLVGYIAQAAEGIAKAHAAGIVHRDLKPGNIMVSRDGFAKVLDFGLAKLTEREASAGPRMTSAPTEDVGTGEGVLLGTVDYMSPEQVQAKPADHRSDIFSMGCILYEAASRRRPFVADTDVEVMHQILRDRPTPVEDINPEVPAELRRIIRRCLAKDPDQRFQSMKDLAIDLREVVEHWDSLPVAGSSVSVSRPAPLAASDRKNAWGRIGVVVALVIGIAGLAIGVSSFLTRRASPRGGLADTPALTTLMSRDDLGEARLSGDGRYLAYVASAGDRSSLSVRQVRTGSDVPIVAPQDFPIRGVSFSPDGDYLYFINRDPDQPNYSALFEVPSLGGTPRKVSFDVDTAVTFSPDGNRVCFRRGILPGNSDTLVVADLKTGEEKTLIRLQGTESFRSPGGTGTPAWSPDGRSIAVSVFSRTAGANGGVRSWIALIDPETGNREDLASQPWLFIDSLAWMPDGNAIVLAAIPLSARSFQIYRFGIRDGRLLRLTNDLDGYQGVSLSGDGKSIAAIRRTIVRNVWSVPIAAASEARALTSATGSSNSVEAFVPLSDGGIAFSAPKGDHVFLWRMDADGSQRRQLTSQGNYVINLGFAEGAGIVFTQVEGSALLHVWRVDPSGENLRQVTSGSGEQLSVVSPDGTALVFWKLEEGPKAWSVTPSGGDPKVFLANVGFGDIDFSGDGRRVLYFISELREGRSYPRHYVIPAGGGEPIASFFLPPGFLDPTLDGTGDAVTYVDRGTGFNLMSRSVATGTTDQLTHFGEGRIVRHRWSSDGHRVAVLRTVGPLSSLWILEPRSERPPTELTSFKTGKIDDFQWARDSKRLVFAYALLNQDVVIMTGDRR